MESKIERRTRRVRQDLRQANRTGRKRLSVFRSNTNIYAQVIDDTAGLTLAAASTVDKKLRKEIKSSASVAAATQIGTEIAKRAKAAGVEEVYFDRGSYRYHGRIKALADAARAAGLKF